MLTIIKVFPIYFSIRELVEALKNDNSHPEGKPWRAAAKKARGQVKGAVQKFVSKFDDDDDDDEGCSLNDN